jgi:hypothetical protein
MLEDTALFEEQDQHWIMGILLAYEGVCLPPDRSVSAAKGDRSANRQPLISKDLRQLFRSQ